MVKSHAVSYSSLVNLKSNERMVSSLKSSAILDMLIAYLFPVTGPACIPTHKLPK